MIRGLMGALPTSATLRPYRKLPQPAGARCSGEVHRRHDVFWCGVGGFCRHITVSSFLSLSACQKVILCTVCAAAGGWGRAQIPCIVVIQLSVLDVSIE